MTELATRTLANVQTTVDAIHGYTKPKLQSEAVVRVFATETGLDSPRTQALLTNHLTAIAGGNLPLMGDFIALEDNSIALAAALTSARPSFIRLFKAARLTAGMDISVENMPALLTTVDGNGGPFNLGVLPTAAPASYDTTLFSGWRALADMMFFAQHITSDAVGLDTVLAAANLGDAQRDIAAATGWAQADVEAITNPAGFGWSYPAILIAANLRQLTEVMTLVKPLSVAAATVLSWAAAPTDGQAENITQALRNRYDNERYLDVAKGLNDALRDMRREALVSFLVPQLADRGVSSASDLLSYLLIDVEMTSCMRTSRVKQAISSVQMFIQRVLMGLENGSPQNGEDVSPAAIDDEQWEWRKSYRVWEANRKVFLYPENWIEPELRLDKSPFFRALEADLRKGELTDEAVEKALSNYLYKLDEVASLQVVAHYIKTGRHGGGPIDVIARTPSSPHQYYHRTYNAVDGWTAWESVDLEVESNHHLLYEMHGRKYFAWARFTEQPNDNSAPSWAVQLFVSEYRDGRWSRPITSQQPLVAEPTIVSQSPPHAYTFAVEISGGDAVVKCYRQCGVLDINEDDFVDAHSKFWDTEYKKKEHKKEGFNWVTAIYQDAHKAFAD